MSRTIGHATMLPICPIHPIEFMPILAAQDVTLAQLKESFGVQQVHDPSFFPEWLQTGATLSPSEAQVLDRIKANFTSLMDAPPVLENSVKMVILAPLLDLLGFYQPPFTLRTEPSIEITTEDEGMKIRGRIDVLVLQNMLLEILYISTIGKFVHDFSSFSTMQMCNFLQEDYLSYSFLILLINNVERSTFGKPKVICV